MEEFDRGSLALDWKNATLVERDRVHRMAVTVFEQTTGDRWRLVRFIVDDARKSGSVEKQKRKEQFFADKTSDCRRL